MATGRHWQAWELDLLKAGARKIPGRSDFAVLAKRKEMHAPRPRDGFSQAAQAVQAEAAFAACDHRFAELSRQSFPAVVDGAQPQFVAVQLRVCQRCACSQSRLWTVNGYATDWHQPKMPTGQEID